MSDVLIVVPVRGGSHGLPRKCARLLGGKPMLWYVLDTCRELGADVVVSTDDDELEMLARRAGMAWIRQPPELSGERGGALPLDPVVAWAVAAQATPQHRIIVTVQATSPFLRWQTIAQAIQAVRDGADTAITVRDDRHLRWTGDLLQRREAHPRRLTRQQMPLVWRETGGVLATKREYVTAQTRFGPIVQCIPVTGMEALDIDTPEDWWLAEAHLASKRIRYRVDGGGALGLGHVYRALTLTGRLIGHDVSLVMDRDHYPAGVRLAETLGASIEIATDSWVPEADIAVLEPGRSREDTQQASQAGALVVTVEDDGPGADIADLTFHDLWSPDLHGPQRYQGLPYAILREEFLSVRPAPIRDDIRHVLLTFGGTDPQDYTTRALAVVRAALPEADVTAVLGPGYAHRPPAETSHVRVIRDVRLLSELMVASDLAVTSCGRTVYELAVCGTPMIACPQNAREQAHGANALRCGAYLSFDSDAISWTLQQLEPTDARQKVREWMLELDLRYGADRFWEIVWQHHRERARGMPHQEIDSWGQSYACVT